MIFNMVGGGAPLNFHVIGGLERPVSPQENTVWVRCEEAKPKWTISPEAPHAPLLNEVWMIPTQRSNITLPVDKKDQIIFGLNSAYRFNGDSWADVDLELWQDGQWKMIIPELFGNGTVSPIIGGFEFMGDDVSQKCGIYTHNGAIALNVWTKSNGYAEAITSVGIVNRKHATISVTFAAGGQSYKDKYDPCIVIGKGKLNYTGGYNSADIVSRTIIPKNVLGNGGTVQINIPKTAEPLYLALTVAGSSSFDDPSGHIHILKIVMS